MSKAKPFLIGTALGASAMFVALQYHVVHSHDGFQIIPRTPQQSVGLAYADIRTWSPSQWTDRPELARALMAHGASDLISESVANTLVDSVSDESSTLEELRTFLNQSASEKKKVGGAAGIPGSSRGGASETSAEKPPENDIFRIPFPQDAKAAISPADPFRVATTTDLGKDVRQAEGSRFSAADVLDDLKDRPAAAMNGADPADRTPAKSQKSSGSVAEQAKEMEDRIFGKGTKSANPTPPAVVKPAAKPETTDSMFEEVSTQLENRAEEALNRARQVVSEKTAAASGDAAKSTEAFLRSKVTELVPETVKPVLKAATGEPGKPAASPLQDFDPFLE